MASRKYAWFDSESYSSPLGFGRAEKRSRRRNERPTRHLFSTPIFDYLRNGRIFLCSLLIRCCFSNARSILNLSELLESLL